jgi:hypothetical protein
MYSMSESKICIEGVSRTAAVSRINPVDKKPRHNCHTICGQEKEERKRGKQHRK